MIEKGEVIFSEPKNEGTSRIVVCAPIKIGETPYYMGVMLQRDVQNQRLYLHNVVIEKEATANSSTADLLTTGADDISERLFITNILQKAINVKQALITPEKTEIPPVRETDVKYPSQTSETNPRADETSNNSIPENGGGSKPYGEKNYKNR